MLSERYLSVVRWAEELREVRNKIQDLKKELEAEGSHDGFWADFLTPRNLAHVAEVVIAAATMREETYGSHFGKDFEKPRKELNQPFFITTRNGQSLQVEARRI